MLKKVVLIFVVSVMLGKTLLGQINAQSWPAIPGFTPELISKKEPMMIVLGGAILSYGITQFLDKDSLNVNFYQSRLGASNEHFWGFQSVAYQNFGFEKRLAPWFALGGEFNLQEWLNKTPENEKIRKLGLGMGLMSYYRWYSLGTHRLSPYLEYGAGVFLGFRKFPYNGSYASFSHSLQVGMEYTCKNNNKIRMSYGLFHQNNAKEKYNASYHGNGFSLSYAWYLNKTKW
jgi:hypothetical protein